jgi:hypothetical protein
MKMASIKSLSACALFLLATVFATHAAPNQIVRAGISVDAAWVAMDRVNEQVVRGYDTTNAGPGILVSLDLGLAVLPFLMVGVRAAYLYCQPTSASFNAPFFKLTQNIQASLVPLELGLMANIALPKVPISIMAGAFGGYGLASATYRNDFVASGQTTTLTLPYAGGALVGEVLAGVHFGLLPFLSMNVHATYRIAKVLQMTQRENVSFAGIPGVSIPVGSMGEILKASDGADLAFDFSGFSLGAGISLGF